MMDFKGLHQAEGETLGSEECVKRCSYETMREQRGRHRIDDLSFGGSILISERLKERVFHISVELGCARWILKQLQDVVGRGELRFFQKFRGDSYQLWMEKSSNKNGYFLRLSKCLHGVVSSVVIPQGIGGLGWRKLEESLEIVLFGETALKSGPELRREEQNEPVARASITTKSYKE
ncbi:hypothetical protein Pyn_14792 [Prunus yedoensis var. nudiflora]|uniref:Uncharacterized protein n=1 Tax=Prunus yedoensis var. nudiflora TaxID=2094558 RepID=A0A314YRR2_PRUYE|nr:hypothetical protein Pyn_14792 [Prunus yedoensis var. nudiflora]